MAMTKERRNEIAYAALKIRTRNELSLRDLDNIDRQLGNTLKEKELVDINVTKEEAHEFIGSLVREILDQQLSKLK